MVYTGKRRKQFPKDCLLMFIPHTGKSRARTLLHSILILFLSLLVILIFSCQSYPAGTHFSDIPPGEEVPSIQDLYRYYRMCQAVWTERSFWRSSGWDLDYFGHTPTNTLGFAVEDKGVLHIVFRGSQAPGNKIDTTINWQYSLQLIFFLENPVFKAHKGMLEKYKGIFQAVHNQIEKYNGAKVMLIGHSAGGMLSMLSYLDLAQSYPDKEFSVVTFGSPRVLNREAALKLDSESDKIFRFVMQKDLIPIIPPPIFGYRHAGTLIRLGDLSNELSFSEAHHPGYLIELSRLLRESGIDPDSLEY